MTSLSARAARRMALKIAAREFKKEIETAGLDNLKTLADSGISIVNTYLNACSHQEKEKKRRALNTFLQMGITPEMLLSELTRQMPVIASIMQSRESYKASEIQKLTAFLQES